MSKQCCRAFLSVFSGLDYRKNPAGVLDKLKSSGANISGSTRKLKDLVSGTCNKRKLEFKKKKPETPFKEIEFEKILKKFLNATCF
jgi:hypothetical protein